jgi:hypothetical protein
MLRRTIPVLLCLLVAPALFAGFSQTQDFRLPTAAEVALKDVDYAPGAAAVILDWVEVDDDTTSVAAEYYRIKILTDDGKKYADVEVPYVAGYPVHGRISDISARTIQPDGTIVPFDGKVYDKVLFKSGRVRVRAKTFSLAGVQAGSVIEYRFQRRWSENLLFNTIWKVQRDIPVLRARMSLRPYHHPDEFGSFFTYHNLPPGKVPARTPKGTFELELTDVPAYRAEELAPPEESLRSRVNFYYTSSTVPPAKFWEVQTNVWQKSIDAFIGKPAAMSEAIKPIGAGDPLQRLEKIYAKAQSFKNLSFEDDSDEAGKKNAADVIAKAEGYRNEIARTFAAMARAAGFDANVVRVAPRDEYFFTPSVPDAEQMSDEIVQVIVGAQTLYCDPGTPTAPFGVVSWEKSNVPGFRIGKGIPPKVELVADQKPEQALMRRVADLRLDGDTLTGTVTVTYTGQEALRRRLTSWGDDETTRNKALETEAKAWFPSGSAVKLAQLTGATSHAEPLVAKYDVTLPNVVSAAGSRTVLPTALFTSTNPFAAATRTYPVYFHYPRREEDQVTVTLPEGLSLAAVPPPAVVDAGALAYSNEIASSGKALTFRRTLTVDSMLIETQYYRSIRNFFSAVVAADQKPLVLVTK